MIRIKTNSFKKGDNGFNKGSRSNIFPVFNILQKYDFHSKNEDYFTRHK